MKQKLIIIVFFFLGIKFNLVLGQNPSSERFDRRFHVVSSAFMLSNFVPKDNPPHFYQLNVGYWLTKKDVISIEAKTWQSRFPIGIP